MIINIDPVALYIPLPLIGWWPIHWYGITWLMAIFGILWYSKKIVTKKTPFDKNDVDDFLFYGVLGAIIGGRLGYMFFYGIEQIFADLTSFFIFSKKLNIGFFDLADHSALAFPIGLGFVRIGNFLGGELLGRPTDLPWGMIFWSDPLQISRHPSQLYQAFFEGVVLFMILNLLVLKPKPKIFISGMFLALYGSFRIFTEIFRMPDSHIGFDFLDIITRGQLLSTPMVIIGLLLIFLSYRNKNETIS